MANKRLKKIKLDKNKLKELTCLQCTWGPKELYFKPKENLETIKILFWADIIKNELKARLDFNWLEYLYVLTSFIYYPTRPFTYTYLDKLLTSKLGYKNENERTNSIDAKDKLVEKGFFEFVALRGIHPAKFYRLNQFKVNQLLRQVSRIITDIQQEL
jgi:hypothetical protein